MNGPASNSKPVRHRGECWRRRALAFVDGEFRHVEISVQDGRIGEVRLAEDESPGARHELVQGVDLGDGWLVPSFTDAHVHLYCMAELETCADLSRCRNVDEVAAVLETNLFHQAGDDAPTAERWIVGWGWNRNDWTGPELDKALVDRTAPGIPVLIRSLDLHSCLVNEAALALLLRQDSFRRLHSERPDLRPRPGLLQEDLAWNADGLLPVPSRNSLKRAMAAIVQALNSRGVTAVASYDGRKGLELLEELAGQDEFSLRVMYSLREEELENDRVPPPRRPMDTPWFDDGCEGRIGRLADGALKLFVDGALNSTTAAMEDDYTGRPGYRGIVVTGPDRLFELVRKADLAGRPAAVHAIGDRAVRLAVEAFERLPPGHCRRHRHRIEHAQLTPSGMETRMADCGLSATTLPSHLPFDIPAAVEHWGTERSSSLHPLRRLVDGGVDIALTSDAPVAPCDPICALRTAVERKDDRGRTFHGEQRLEPRQALRALCSSPARLLFAEKLWGSIRKGRSADLVLLSDNPLSPHARPRVLATFFEGRPVYRAP